MFNATVLKIDIINPHGCTYLIIFAPRKYTTLFKNQKLIQLGVAIHELI